MIVRSYDNASYLGRASKALQIESSKSETGEVRAIRRGSYWYPLSEAEAAAMIGTGEAYTVVYCTNL